MKTLLKNAREAKGFKVREVAEKLQIDQALISKFENGSRKPTRAQVQSLAILLDIDYETLMVCWLKERILYEIGDNEFGLKALQLAEAELGNRQGTTQKVAAAIQKILDDIDILRKQLDNYTKFDSNSNTQKLDLEYTFESNRIDDNTLTLRETDLVINSGVTITGKSMREHLEAINHHEAIAYIRQLVETNTALSYRELMSIHNLTLRGIKPAEPGPHHFPPQPNLPPMGTEELFVWYDANKSKIHPVLLAAEMHERLITMHPFADGNARTARLVMNLILLQQGYVIANIKGDNENRMRYYASLEKAQATKERDDYLLFIAQIEKESLERYLKVISQ